MEHKGNYSIQALKGKGCKLDHNWTHIVKNGGQIIAATSSKQHAQVHMLTLWRAEFLKSLDTSEILTMLLDLMTQLKTEGLKREKLPVRRKAKKKIKR
jgi:hypothetical protein